MVSWSRCQSRGISRMWALKRTALGRSWLTPGRGCFVNFDREAEPLDQFLGVLPEHFKDFDIGNRYIETHVCKRLPVNWKAAEEAFMEAYHVKETHAGGRDFQSQ